MRQYDPVAKRLLRSVYRQTCGAVVLSNLAMPRRADLAVYYGGARVGDVGGPLVKVRRLNEHFPEVRFGFNLVYLLSNTPYLPAWALRLVGARRIPIVYNQNGVYYQAWYDGDWQAKNREMALAYHAADWVFYQSAFCQRAAQHFLGERSGRGEILYNAIDTDHFIPRERWSESRSPYTFLLTGKIGEHMAYRLENTIAGLQQARKLGLDARLTIAGWVAEGARYSAEALARKLGVTDYVTYFGSYTQSQAPAIYQSADAYVMTKHNDPCPNTVLEAMACGLPVLYSDTGGVPELVGDASGIPLDCPEDWNQCHAPDPRLVGEGMLQIAENHAMHSIAARTRAVEKFDLVHWVSRHREIFADLLMRGDR